MKNMNLLLHVGLPRSASRTLQYGLFDQHSEFESIHHFSKDPEKKELALYLMRVLKLGKKPTSDEKAKYAAQFRKLLKGDACVVLSNEGLTSHVGKWPNKLTATAKLSREMLGGEEATSSPRVLLMYRGLHEYLWSGYVQDCAQEKSDKPIGSFEEYSKRIVEEAQEEHGRLRFGDMATAYAEAFGKDYISVLSLRYLSQRPEQAYCDICNFVDITPDDALFATLALKRHNTWEERAEKNSGIASRLKGARQSGLSKSLLSEIEELESQQLEKLRSSGVHLLENTD